MLPFVHGNSNQLNTLSGASQAAPSYLLAILPGLCGWMTKLVQPWGGCLSFEFELGSFQAAALPPQQNLLSHHLCDGEDGNRAD